MASRSLDNEITLLGECKSLNRAAEAADLERVIRTVMGKAVPANPGSAPRREYVIFIPELKARPNPLPPGITIVDGKRVFAALKDHVE
ncbi:MAG: hypothetical protein K9N49_10970 [Candidatus Marinimicrobia bacterium]|nr:hypothetical protein [Candidatus Neomarinimicrobiota bacterium]